MNKKKRCIEKRVGTGYFIMQTEIIMNVRDMECKLQSAKRAISRFLEIVCGISSTLEQKLEKDEKKLIDKQKLISSHL
jgi:nicotinate-nucleotide pyrophosphorylase